MKKQPLIILSIILGIFITVGYHLLIYLPIKSYDSSLLIPFDQFGKIPLCNRNIERAIIINDFVFPLCIRCTFMILFFFLSLFLSKISIVRSIIIKFGLFKTFIIACFLIIPLIIDGLLVYFSSYDGTNILRIITGMLFGIGSGLFTRIVIIRWFNV